MLKVERKRFECHALPKGWTREEVVRRSGLSAGKVDVFYYSPNGKKFRTKPQLVRYLGDAADLTTFDFRTGKINSVLLRKNRKKTQPDYSRGIRSDASLISPIRQTASIFKQPVTIVRSQDAKVRQEIKHGNQDKPKQNCVQLFWEKRLENLKFNTSHSEIGEINLSTLFKPVGPNVKTETALQSLVSALHTAAQGASITGQTGSTSALEKNAGVFLNPDQPLVQTIVISEEDIRKQEERVVEARLKLQEALRSQ
nr:EOG090X0BDJ [Sida crystallina]